MDGDRNSDDSKSNDTTVREHNFSIVLCNGVFVRIHELTRSVCQDFDSTYNQAKQLLSSSSNRLVPPKVDENDILQEDEKIVILGVFPDFSGEKFEMFCDAAVELDYDYCFVLTSDPSVSDHIVRFFNPSEERIVETTIFSIDALMCLIKDATIPDVILYNDHPRRFVNTFLYGDTEDDKVMLFIHRDSEGADTFESQYHEVAKKFRTNDMLFMLGDLVASQDVFRFFALDKSTDPLIVILTCENKLYVKRDLKPEDDIEEWVKNFKDDRHNRKVPKFEKPVVRYRVTGLDVDAFQKVVIDSGKHVFLVVCGSRYFSRLRVPLKLHAILDDVAAHFERENYSDIIFVTMDRNSALHLDYIGEILAPAVEAVTKSTKRHPKPTLCLKLAGSNKAIEYNGVISPEEIIKFINKKCLCKGSPLLPAGVN